MGCLNLFLNYICSTFLWVTLHEVDDKQVGESLRQTARKNAPTDERTTRNFMSDLERPRPNGQSVGRIDV